MQVPMSLTHVHFQRVISGEMGLAGIEVKVLRLFQCLPDAVMALSDRRPHPLHDGREIDVPHFGRDAELRRFPDFNDSIRRIDEDLRGDSPHVETGSSRRSPVHEGDGLIVLERILDKVRPAAGAYYDNVVFLHETISFRARFQLEGTVPYL